MEDVNTTATASDPIAAGEPDVATKASGFTVNLDVYSGPFDVLLGMVANRRLELTEVSLSAITEEFLDYARGLDFTADMDEASSFLDVASILVEAKSAALLPADLSGERDERSMFAHAPVATVSTRQLHVPLVDLEAQAVLVRDRLRALGEDGSMTFAELVADADGRAEVVGRFLAVLMFFKQGSVQFRQAGPYEALHLRWTPDQPSFADEGTDGAVVLKDVDAVSIDERDLA